MFVDSRRLSTVSKQAPCAWYKELSSFLLANGFVNSKSDSSLFIYSHNGIQVYLLVYVDNLIVTGSDASFISKFILDFSRRFSLKDFGALHYFLGAGC